MIDRWLEPDELWIEDDELPEEEFDDDDREAACFDYDEALDRQLERMEREYFAAKRYA